MSVNGKKIGFFMGFIGGAFYGATLDVARRCGGLSNCDEETLAHHNIRRALFMSDGADVAQKLVCDGPDDDGTLCQLAQHASVAASMYFLFNVLSYYPASMAMALAGGVLGAAVGDAIDRCLTPAEENHQRFAKN